MRKLFILAAAFVCLLNLISCGTIFAPPPVTTQLARPGLGHVDVASLRQGRNLFVSRCIECHTLPPFWHYRTEDWPHIIDAMAERSKLTRSERDAMVAYILAVRAQ